MTRHLASLTQGAEKLAGGDLDVQVPVPHGREFRRLAETFNRLAGDLRKNQERLIEQERLRKELEIGRRIQVELLPRGVLRSLFAEIRGVSIPAKEVGGDFFNYFALSESETVVLVGDVSGKGVGAALLMASVQATIRARLSVERDLARLVDALDREMESEEPLAPYYTLFLAVLDGPSGRLRYVNAGHNTQIVLRHDGAEWLSSTGRPPGLYPGGGFEEREIQLRGGDALFLFTDGLVEAEDESGEPFGIDRIEALLEVHRSQDLTRLLGHVDAAVRAHRGPLEAHRRRDDGGPALLERRARGTRVRRQLEALEAREWDVLVVGGGIHGAAVAWDAAQRGLATALVEREDFGSGASWNSLKTIHGGMRHLQRLEIGSLRESVRERSTLLRIAARARGPAAVLRSLLWLRRARARRRFAIGLALSDAAQRATATAGCRPSARSPRPDDRRRRGAAAPARPRAARAQGRSALARRPGREQRAAAGRVRPRRRGGGCRGGEPREAVELPEGGRAGDGRRVRDALAGRTLAIRARMVLNAAGPGSTRSWPRAEAAARRSAAARRATSSSPPDGCALRRGRAERRPLPVPVPWQDRAIVGTAYEPAETRRRARPRLFRDGSRPRLSLGRAGAARPRARPRRARAGARGTRGLATRGRVCTITRPKAACRGSLTIQGVKYTTARALAERAVDRVVGPARPPGGCLPDRGDAPREGPSCRGTLEERTRQAVREEMAATLADAVLRRLDLGTAGPPAQAELETVTAGVMARSSAGTRRASAPRGRRSPALSAR